MGTITIVNQTLAPINSLVSNSNINMSWRNKINPNEFYIHNAPPIFHLNLNNYTGPDSMFHENPDVIGKIIGVAVLNLVGLGLSVASFGGAAALMAGVVSITGLASVTAEVGLAGIGAALAVGTLGVDTGHVAINHNETNFKQDNIEARFDNVYVVTGGFNGHTSSYDPFKVTPISREEFDRLRIDNQIYEETSKCYRIWYDDQKNAYYNHPDGYKVYNPDGAEYVVENGKKVAYSSYKKKQENVRTDLTYSEPVTSNTNGSWGNEAYVRNGRAAIIQARNQGKYGIINSRLFDYEGKLTVWTADNMGSGADNYETMPMELLKQATKNEDGNIVFIEGELRSKMDGIKMLKVKEQEGYGIIDIMCVCKGQNEKGGECCGWAVKNEAERKIHLYEIHTPANKEVVGLVGKEQGGFGLVDMKIIFAPSNN